MERRTSRFPTPLLLAALVAAAPPVLAEDLPAASRISNQSKAAWTVRLKARAKGDVLEVGSIRFCDDHDDAKVMKELSSGTDTFVLQPGASCKVYYLDATKSVLTKAADRIHNVTFYLVDGKGRKFELLSERKASPLSNVFVKAIVGDPLRNLPEAQKALHLNEFEPGNLTLTVDTVPDNLRSFAP